MTGKEGAASQKVIHSSLVIGWVILFCLVCGCATAPGKSLTENPGSPGNVSITVTDTLGNTVTFPHPVQRIVCQNGGSAEVLASIGAGDLIVGLSNTSLHQKNYVTNRTPNAQNFGDTYNPDLETLVTLQPDVLIAYSDSSVKPRNLDKILAANITVVYQKVYDIRDLRNETLFLGRITGKDENAQRLNQFNEKYLSLIKSRVQDIRQEDGPTVYFEQIIDYMVNSRDSSGDYILNLVHARNIAGNITQQNAIVSPEWVLDKNPDVIIRMVSGGKNMTGVCEDIPVRAGLSRINAVENQRVYCVSGSLLSGPREIIGALYIAKAIHPDRFPDVDPEVVLHEYAREFLPGSDTDMSFYPDLPVSGQVQVTL